MTDKEMEFDELLKQAEAGDMNAMFKVSRAYANGTGTEVNLEQVFYWEKRAAEANHTIAKYNLALSYRNGIGTVVDLDKYFEWIKKAAEAGNISSIFNLSRAYKNGTGTKIDLDKYFEWTERAALKKHKNAMFNLALAYKNGTGTKIDLDKYFEWTERAALEKHKDSIFNLSLAYKNGTGTKINLDKYFEWTERAALEEHKDAMFNLSRAYKNGIGTVADLDKYFEWTERAALKEHVNAMHNLSLAYKNGIGTAANLDRYFEWAEKAALQNHAGAMFNLGVSYKDGIGVEADIDKFFSWTTQAAELGIAEAMFNLGHAFRMGLGTKKDLKIALDWYLKAGKANFNWAYVVVIYSSFFKKAKFKESYHFALDKYMQIYFPQYNTFKEADKDLAVNFSRLIKILIDIENKHLYKPGAEKMLYHYTSQVVIQKILNSEKNKNIFENRLRLYMANYLNDPTEGRYIFDIGFEQSVKNLDNIRNIFEVFSQDQDCLVDDCKEQIYSLSFSENPDNLNLWRAYGRGNNGEANGVGLGVSYETLKQFYALTSVGIHSKKFLHAEEMSDKEVEMENLFLLYSVKYGKQPVEKMWKKVAPPLNFLLKRIKKKYRKNKDVALKLFYCVYLAMSRLMYLYKHDAYAAEEEVRALAMGALTDPNLMADERSPARLYFNTPAILFQHKDSEIILGPQISPEDKAVLVWSLRKRIVDLKLGDKVTIKSSTVPFR